MPQLNVYKASAGSGKTWRLTVEYLKLLIARPESHRNILAVTFTNKATAEMKERVLNALYNITRNPKDSPPDDMLKTVCAELGISTEKARSQAILALGNLLHDYGRFRIETIDSFFQSILRNLARELGLGAWLNIELNNDSVLSDAVDALVDRAGTSKELLGWMTDFIEDQLQEGKSWKIDQQLKSFGHTIFKEYFKEKEKQLNEKLSNKGFLRAYKKELRELELKGVERLKEQSVKFFRILDNNALKTEDLSRGKTGPAGYFLKLENGILNEDKLLNSYVLAALEDPSKWTTKTSKLNASITSLAVASLNPLLEESETLRKEMLPRIQSARMAVKHLNQVGLLTDIAAEVRSLNQENNRFLLSDTNALLKSLIQGADASFVYEKTGTEIQHILFDEFQDTSRMQWDTFKPLLAEGLANGYDSLVVGDEKQSIYRWRNGDWRILGNIAGEMKPARVDERKLEFNWRSQRCIIDFNNALFGTLEKQLNLLHSEQFGDISSDLRKAYSDVAQRSNGTPGLGRVEFTFLSTGKNDRYSPMVLNRLIRKVEELQQNGVKPSQIAILIRVNKDIPRIGEFFAEYKAGPHSDPALCYDIVSDEAFLLRSSKAVQILTDALRLLHDPSNPIPQALLKLDYLSDVVQTVRSPHELFKQPDLRRQSETTTAYRREYRDSNPDQPLLPAAFVDRFEALQRLPLYELVEELYRIFTLDTIPAQDSYMHCFMDKLSEYLLHSPADLGSFLEHWDSKMADTSIPAGPAVNGIRILSIHKSKGLEFHSVLLPFCDWPLLTNQKLQVWCSPEEAPFNQLDLLPVDYSRDMAESFFNKEYSEETLQLWVDALNLLYVALTRARENLFVFCKGSDLKKENKTPSTIAELVQNVLMNGLSELEDAVYEPAVEVPFEPLTASESPEAANQEEENPEEDKPVLEARFYFGTFHPVENKPDQKAQGLHNPGTDLSIPFRSYSHKTRFRQSNRSKAYCKGLDPEGFHSSYIDRGKLLHQLFSEMRTAADLGDALQKLLNEGLIQPEETDELEAYLRNALSNKQAQDWYSGHYQLYNECSILCPGPDGKLQLKRPDRVMLADHAVQIVDFKFGKPSPSYKKQVLEYMNLLKGMGYTDVKGYLWYVDTEQIEAVS